MNDKLYRLLVIVVFSFFALGCSTDDNNPVNPPAPPTPPAPQPEQPVADKVETQFSGNIAILADGGEQIVGFLQKRFTNMSTEVTDLTHAVLLNEKSSATILGDDAQLATVASLWERGGAAIFVHPGKSALQLVLKLNAVLVGSEPATITDEVAASFKDIVIMIVKADGDALLCNNIGSQNKVYNLTTIVKDAEGDEAVEDVKEPEEKVITFTPSDYLVGRLAEQACAWLNSHYSANAQPLHSAFGATRGDDENSYSATIDYKPVIAVEHDMGERYGWCGESDCPDTDYVEALVRISVITGWNESVGKDVYDFTITEGYDPTGSIHEEVLIHEYMAYNYRYSGGFYYGPTVETRLTTDVSDFSMSSNSTIYSPVPVAESGSYSETHDPGSTTLGGGISVAGGSSGVMVTGSFNFSVTLPKTTVSVSVDDMPVTHETNYNDYINWDYRSTYTVHSTDWGTNPGYHKPPHINTSNCLLTQAATYAVGNSSALGESPVYLDCLVKFKTHHELAQAEIISGSSHIKEDIEHVYDVPAYPLPIVRRFSELYDPVCTYNSGDIESWETLQAVLIRNANYNAFNEGFKICAATEPGVEEAAKLVWKSALEDLVETNKAHDAKHEYVIMLKDESNKYVPMALHIKGKTWEIAEDGYALLNELDK